MNTPSHAILNLAVMTCGGPSRRRLAPAVFAGSLVPDLPMFGFYLWCRLVARMPESEIWGRAYFDPSWQLLFDVFNSIPLAVLGWLVSRRLGSPTLAALFASVGLHALCDLPVHHDAAHRHFLPLSAWRFEAPLSYWDPAHGGAFVALAEIAGVWVASLVLWDRFPRPWVRVALVSVNLAYASGYLGFYVVRG